MKSLENTMTNENGGFDESTTLKDDIPDNHDTNGTTVVGGTCHVVPCNIKSFCGQGNVDIYFRPTEVPLVPPPELKSDHVQNNNNDCDKGNAEQSVSPNNDNIIAVTTDAMPPPSKRQRRSFEYHAATFRGRGLLADVARSSDNDDCDCTLQDDSIEKDMGGMTDINNDNPSVSRSRSKAPDIHGRLFEVDVDDSCKNGNANDTTSALDTEKKNHQQVLLLQQVATFRQIIEWEHEHDIGQLLGRKKQQQSLVQTACDWIEVASVLHTPVPIV